MSKQDMEQNNLQQNNLQKNKAILKNFELAICRGDVDGVKALISDDVQVITMGSSVVSATRNYDQLIELVKGLDSVTTSGIEMRFISMTAEEDRVSCEMEGNSTLLNGTAYNNQYHVLAHIRDGKIYLLKEYMDTKYADATVGAMLASQNMRSS